MSLLMYSLTAKSRVLLVAAIMAVTTALSAGGYTVVLDPGHGAHDAGAVGATGNEKTINLAVAKGVRDILSRELKDCKVVMTRSDDTFIPLQRRADIANNNHGDIFVSIHVNSVAKDAPNRATVHGASVYTLGLEKSGANMEVARRENAVITLESDYTTKYNGFDPTSTESYIMFEMGSTANLKRSIDLARSIQGELTTTASRADRGVRQAPFYVLVKTSMPAVLVELDFICNPEQERFMMSDEGRQKLSRAVANGIIGFVGGQTSDTKKVNKPKPEKVRETPKPQVKKETTPKPQPVETGTVYKIQFLTSGKKVLPNGDARFKGLDGVSHYRDTDGMVKYTVGSFSTPAEANSILKQVRKQFPQAFVIKMCDGKRVK